MLQRRQPSPRTSLGRLGPSRLPSDKMPDQRVQEAGLAPEKHLPYEPPPGENRRRNLSAQVKASDVRALKFIHHDTLIAFN